MPSGSREEIGPHTSSIKTKAAAPGLRLTILPGRLAATAFLLRRFLSSFFLCSFLLGWFSLSRFLGGFLCPFFFCCLLFSFFWRFLFSPALFFLSPLPSPPP